MTAAGVCTSLHHFSPLLNRQPPEKQAFRGVPTISFAISKASSATPLGTD